jgi:divalent metal cation (Fe/Co/Zn/Cd) transporter
VVLLEDAGALFGLFLALGGIGLYVATGDVVWDAVGTLCIGVLLVVIAVFLSIEMKSMLIGESALEADIAAIKRALEASPEVVRVIDLRTQHIGPEELLVAAKVEFSGTLSAANLAGAINAAEASIRNSVPYAHRIYLEPDMWRADHVPTPDAPIEAEHGHG